MNMPAQSQTAPLAARPSHVPPDRVVQFDMYHPDGIEDGYFEAWKRFQAAQIHNIVWTPYNEGHWIAMRGAWIRDIFRDVKNFSNKVIFLPKMLGEKHVAVPSTMDPPEHTPYRAIVDKGLNLREMRLIEDQVRQLAIALIETFEGKGHCDFSLEYAEIFPIQVFMMLTDLPMHDAPLLMKFAAQMTRPEGATPEAMAAALEQANTGFADYVSAVIDQRVGRNGTDLISLAVNSKVGDNLMSKDYSIRMISLLLLAGLDTVVNFLSMFMDFLGRNPAVLKELVDNPSKIPRSAEEFFRRFPLVASARLVTNDIERDGVTLKKGDMILLPTPLHGLDDQENPNPWLLDFDRKGISHSTFGHGPHRCAGLHLARMEVTITLQEWLKRIPVFRASPAVKPKYDSGTVAAIAGVVLEWDAVPAGG